MISILATPQPSAPSQVFLILGTDTQTFMSIRITGDFLWATDSWILPQTYKIRTSRDGALEWIFLKVLRWLWWVARFGKLRYSNNFPMSVYSPQTTQLIQDHVVKPASLWHPYNILLPRALFGSPNNSLFLTSFPVHPFLANNLHISSFPAPQLQLLLNGLSRGNHLCLSLLKQACLRRTTKNILSYTLTI